MRPPGWPQSERVRGGGDFLQGLGNGEQFYRDLSSGPSLEIHGPGLRIYSSGWKSIGPASGSILQAGIRPGR